MSDKAQPHKEEKPASKEHAAAPTSEFAPLTSQHTALPPDIQRLKREPRTLSSHDALSLQRTIGNRAVGKILVARKPANPSLQRHAETDAHAHGCGCAQCSSAAPIQREPSHSAGCGCAACGGGTQQIQAQRHIQREPGHSTGCGCSVCSGSVQQIQPQRIIQRTHQATPQARPVIQLHGAERKRIKTRNVVPVTMQRTASPQIIQRHSSWEHQLLGDAQPTDLAKIGTWQELISQTERQGFMRTPKQAQAEVNIENVGRITKGNVMHVIAQELQRLDEWQQNPPQKASGGQIDPKYQTVLISIPGGKKDGTPLIITYGEMNTLADYYGSLDVMKSAERGLRWEVIQSVRKETFLRLSDIYEKLKDSLTTQEKTDDDVKSSEAMIKQNKTSDIYFNRNKFKNSFEADFISGKAGQITLLKFGGAGATGVNEYSATLGRNACHFVPESWHAWSSYHQKGREKAQQAWNLKQSAEEDRQEAITIQSEVEFGSVEGQDSSEAIQKQIEDLNKSAEEKIAQAGDAINEALLNNGFGDHYLQDSYAAGHMINKTKIMQWFIQWLDTKSWNMDFATDENWRKVQAIAYRQPELASAMQYDKTQIQGHDDTQTTNRAKNPQAVEDIGGDDWTVRFRALGLQVPSSLSTPGTPSRRVMEWWQAQAATNGDLKNMTGEALLANSANINFTDLKAGLKNLIADGIVYVTEFDASKSGTTFLSGKFSLDTRVNEEAFKLWQFSIRDAYIPKHQEQFTTAVTESSENGDDSQYQKMAMAVTYQDYMAFMNNAYVQKSTNALHDVFCLKGLQVSSGEGQQLFKVYGDDSMFNANSANGVKHSGETANMSRDAIRNIFTNGNDGGITTQNILNRLPSHVKPEGGSTVSIQAWHDPSATGQLKTYCETVVFPGMGMLDKAVGLTGSLSDFISKDKAKVHGEDAF